MTQIINESQPLTEAERQATLLNLSKLLLDEDRLKILGLLAQQPCSMETLAAQTAVARVKLHLHKMTEVGLVRKRTEQGCEVYQLDSQQVLQFKKLLFARPEPAEFQSPAELEQLQNRLRDDKHGK